MNGSLDRWVKTTVAPSQCEDGQTADAKIFLRKIEAWGEPQKWSERQELNLRSPLPSVSVHYRQFSTSDTDKQGHAYHRHEAAYRPR